MGFNVVYQPNAQTVGDLAFATGHGQYNERQRDKAREAAQQQQQLAAQQQSQQFAHQADLERLAAQNIYSQQQGQREFGQRLALGGVDAQREAAAGQARFEQQKQLEGLQFQQRSDLAKQGNQLDRENWDYQFNAKQQSDIARYTNGLDWVRNSNMRPKEKKWATSQLQAKLHGFEPLPVPKPKQPQFDMKQIVSERVHQNPDGSTFYAQPDGKLEYRPPPKPPAPPKPDPAQAPLSFEDFNKQYGDVVKSLTTRNDQGGVVTPGHDAVLEELDRRRAAYQRRYAPPPPPPGPPAGPMGPPQQQGWPSGPPPLPDLGPGPGGPPQGPPPSFRQQIAAAGGVMGQAVAGQAMPPPPMPRVAMAQLEKNKQDAPVPVRSPEEAKVLRPGTVFMTPDGRIFQR